MKKEIHDLSEDDHSIDNPDYIKLYNHLKLWLSKTNIFNINEKILQLDFYQNCMKTYNQHIDHVIEIAEKSAILSPKLAIFADFLLIIHSKHTKSVFFIV